MKKVKKFGRGGDIITGLGAVLVGKALYDKYKEGKGGDKDDYASRVKEYNAKNKPAEDNKPEEAVSIAKKEPSAGEKRAMAASKGQPEMGDVDKDVAESDKALVRTAPKGSKPAPKGNKPAPKAAATKTDITTPKVATSRSFAPDKKEGTVSKPYPIKSKPNEARTTKTSPMMVRDVADKKASDLSVPKGLDLKSTNKTVYGTDTTSLFQKKAAQERAEAEEKAKKKAKDAAQAKEFRERSLQPMKKGGMVKKYASGGTTTSKPEPKKDTMPEWAKNERANRKQDELNKREAEGARKEVKRNMSTFGFKKGGSASSRADGIAIRGKTRA